VANEEVVAPATSWLGEEPLEMESTFATDGVGEIPFRPIGEVEDWELILPSTSDRVCSTYENYVFRFQRHGFPTPFFQLSARGAPLDQAIPLTDSSQLLCLYEGFRVVVRLSTASCFQECLFLLLHCATGRGLGFLLSDPEDV
jgi:hypothetical protein